MNVLIKNIRKLMGWCPNAKMLETQRSIHSEYFETNDQAKGRDAGNPPVLPTDWWNKRHNRALIISSALTLFSILGIGFLEVHPMDKGFIFGLIIGTIFNLYICIWNWHYLNNIKNTGKKIKKNIRSPKWRVINIILSLVLLYLFFSQSNWGLVLFFISAFCLIALFYYFNFDSTGLVLLLVFGSSLGWRHTIGFISGFCLTAFLYYLTDIFWEKRNGKILLVYGHKMPEIYIVNA
ncbi:DUF1673 domain-containing protein [Methanosarcina sp. UBA411]|jgi:hypothetical protein|uniref:DUF1673 domain-containing protein n=1 Tax=Methanosarcina sp. UBA411 TaxID=1915589 RepID=UPI0025FB571D|nr:DUF1673 domain-containing protein [Methanosarcina sp. UBA411]